MFEVKLKALQRYSSLQINDESKKRHILEIQIIHFKTNFQFDR